MMGTMASPLFDPEVESMICTVVLGLDIILVLLIIFFSFLAVKIDSRVNWAWATVWIPLWIIDVFLLYILGRFLLSSLSSSDDDDEDNDDDDDDDDEQQDDNNNNNNNRKSKKAATRRRMRWVTKSVFMVYFILTLLFQIFIVINLDQKVSWSAAVIFIPYFILEGLNFILTVVDYGLALSMVPWSMALSLFFNKFWLFCLRLVLFVLIALRIDHTITCSWAVVFIPLYLVAVKYAIQLGISYHRFARLSQQPQVAQQGKMTVLVGVVMWVVVCALVYALVGMVARRLDGYWYISMATVFVPVFIVLAVVICCCGCCLPCLMMVSTMGDLDDLEQVQSLIDPNRRITQAGEH
ncbi:hypothetical protein BC941DRAFT_114062 [Chlamydoabsidia padenii]|nr:hypothetical protein BC941DRAFT_114062 [Chlamydoabsidia padenii]